MAVHSLKNGGWNDAALWIIKIGLWLIPFLPLYISSSMLFPFITGKNFVFRIIVEIIFALWVGLAVARPEFRPKLTPLFKAATLFIIFVFLADLFGPNPYRSFFSNYERMEGFMMLGHLYLYFVVLSSVFKTRTDWLVFFHSTLVASLVVSSIGLMQRLGYRVSLQGGFRVDSTIGNPTYLAAYLLFHIWMLVILLKEFWKKWWLLAMYSAALFFELLILYFTATRGAVLALLLVTALFWVISVIFWNKLFYPGVISSPDALSPAPSLSVFKGGVNGVRPWSKGRKFATGLLILMLVTPIFFWQIRHTEFVQNTNVLKRLVNYSLDEKTIQSRFKIWGMSAKGFLDRPVLGWGQENYYLVFQKYFHPGLFAQEPWFDRSHNLFFDWLIHAGVLGLASFLSVIGIAFYYIFKAAWSIRFPRFNGMVLAAVFLSYLLQNVFVFDNLNTYILFFAFLAYTEWLAYPHISGETSPSYERREFIPALQNKGFAIALILLLAVFSSGYYLHLKPMKESKALIQTLQLAQTRGISMERIINAFKGTLSYRSFGDTEVREQMANFARSVPGNSSYSPEDQKKFVQFTVEEFRKETTNPAKDIKHMLFLASILSRAQQFDPQYGPEAERLLLDAIKLSPTKQIIQLELAQLYLSQGKTDATLDILKRVVELEPNYMQAKVNLLLVATLAKRNDIAKEVIDSGINITVLDEDALKRLGGIYVGYQLHDRAKPVYIYLTGMAPGKAEYRAALAAILGELGEYDAAIEEAKKAAELDNSFAAEAEAFIKIMEQRKVGR